MQTMFDDENRQENEFADSRLQGEKKEEFEELIDDDEEEEDENQVEDQEEEGERGEEEKIGIDFDDVDPDPWNTIAYVIP